MDGGCDDTQQDTSKKDDVIKNDQQLTMTNEEKLNRLKQDLSKLYANSTFNKSNQSNTNDCSITDESRTCLNDVNQTNNHLLFAPTILLDNNNTTQQFSDVNVTSNETKSSQFNDLLLVETPLSIVNGINLYEKTTENDRIIENQLINDDRLSNPIEIMNKIDDNQQANCDINNLLFDYNLTITNKSDLINNNHDDTVSTTAAAVVAPTDCSTSDLKDIDLDRLLIIDNGDLLSSNNNNAGTTSIVDDLLDNLSDQQITESLPPPLPLPTAVGHSEESSSPTTTSTLGSCENTKLNRPILLLNQPRSRGIFSESKFIATNEDQIENEDSGSSSTTSTQTSTSPSSPNASTQEHQQLTDTQRPSLTATVAPAATVPAVAAAAASSLETTSTNRSTSENKSSAPSSEELNRLKNELNSFSEDQRLLGIIVPEWVPDEEADECMKCANKFTFTKRRHHCRACGLLFCSNCCNLRISLAYNQKEQSRVCVNCYPIIDKINHLKKGIDELTVKNEQPIVSVLKKEGKRKNYVQAANNDELTTTSSEHSSTQASASATASALPTDNPQQQHSSNSATVVKSVRFSDGIAPGCDLAEDDSHQASHHNASATNAQRTKYPTKIQKQSNRNRILNNANKFASRQIKLFELELINKLKQNLNDNSNCLPPLTFKGNLNVIGVSSDENEIQKALEVIRSPNHAPVSFVLLKNVKVNVKIINLSCCVKKECWVFVTQGLCAIGQDELVFVIECIDSKTDKIPQQLFAHIIDIYDRAVKGIFLHSMCHSLYHPANPNENNKIFLDNKDNAGFLFFQPATHHCVKNLEPILPEQPYLIGILIQRWEIPWAKLFPLRLYLTLGAEFKIYPCPFVSSRMRKPVFCEIGHTIMNILCDVRNFQYTIPQLDGLNITINDNHTLVRIPQSQYKFVMKSILTSNDYVFSIGSLNFNEECDSHLVTIENENSTSYLSRTITKHAEIPLDRSENTANIKRNQTGAAFIVFNGSLKSSLAMSAKLSIIEDGIMVQIDSDTMVKLKQALESMKSFCVECKKLGIQQLQQQQQENKEPDDVITIEWYQEETFLNRHVRSPIDNMSMSGIRSSRISNSHEYMSSTKLIRWSEVFLIKIDEGNSLIESSFDLNNFAETCSQATCIALLPVLDDLANETLLLISQEKLKSNDDRNNVISKSLFKLGLRISIERDQVGYQIGSFGTQINDEKYLSNLDNELIPLLNRINNTNICVIIELIFYILDKVSLEFYANENSQLNETTSKNNN